MTWLVYIANVIFPRNTAAFKSQHNRLFTLWFSLKCFMHDCSLWADSEDELFKSDEDECAEHFRNVSALSCGLKAGFYLFIRSTIL